MIGRTAGRTSLGRDRRGTTAVEMALVAATLFPLLLGGFELGRLVWVWLGLQRAADLAARCWATGADSTNAGTKCADSSAARTYATTKATSLGAANFATAGSVTPATNAAATANYTLCATPGVTTRQVTLTYTFSSPLANLVPMFNKQLTVVGCFPSNS